MSDRGNEPFTFEKKVICVHTTPESIKVTPLPPHTAEAFWIPQECIHEDSEVYKKGDEGKLVVKMYKAISMGWTDGDSD